MRKKAVVLNNFVVGYVKESALGSQAHEFLLENLNEHAHCRLGMPVKNEKNRIKHQDKNSPDAKGLYPNRDLLRTERRSALEVYFKVTLVHRLSESPIWPLTENMLVSQIW